MTRVSDLIPGDVFDASRPGPGLTAVPATAVYVAQSRHPLWPKLQLVIWRMSDDAWSFDALSPIQDVGQPLTSDPFDRINNLRAALLGQT